MGTRDKLEELVQQWAETTDHPVESEEANYVHELLNEAYNEGYLVGAATQREEDERA